MKKEIKKRLQSTISELNKYKDNASSPSSIQKIDEIITSLRDNYDERAQYIDDEDNQEWCDAFSFVENKLLTVAELLCVSFAEGGKYELYYKDGLPLNLEEIMNRAKVIENYKKARWFYQVDKNKYEPAYLHIDDIIAECNS